MKNKSDVQRFGERIKVLRDKAGLTQDALAFGAEISTRTVQRIEAGAQAITIDLFFSLAKGLQMQPSEIFKGFLIEWEE